MRPARYSYTYASSNNSGKPLKSRMIQVVLVLVAVVLLVLVARGHPLVGTLKTTMGDVFAPIMELVTAPVRGVQHMVENKQALFRAYEENKQLRDENDTLRHWEAVAQTLKAENEALRKLAAYTPVENIEYVTAKVIAQSPDAYAGMLMIDAGQNQGLKSLQPVIDAYGLIGRVLEVSDNTARVLLLSDSSSRVPVITGNSRQHAILAGTGDELLRLTFIGGDPQDIELGEPIMTTSEGGLIPESVMVGTVFRREAGALLVKPSRPLSQPEYVRVMMSK